MYMHAHAISIIVCLSLPVCGGTVFLVKFLIIFLSAYLRCLSPIDHCILVADNEDNGFVLIDPKFAVTNSKFSLLIIIVHLLQ